MEAKGCTGLAAGGELMTTQLRRIHVIYFLSRMGRIEHPHLIRVHHLSRNGVYLRDVKRWLSDLRGKDMPDSFAWSYKRRYKAGYVWQDLVDEDLVTPISDNEYVLKGSEISSVLPLDACSCGEKKSCTTENPDTVVEDKLQQPFSEIGKMEEVVSAKTSEIEESSESSSTMTDDSIKSNKSKLEKEEKNSSEKKKKKKNKKSNSNTEKTEQPPLTSSSATFTKSKSYSSGASYVFRNLLTCGAIDTNDSAMMTINRVQRNSKNNNPSSEAIGVCKTETIGGSHRTFGTACNQQQNSRKSSNGMKSSKNTNEKTVSAACKPVAEPICSQCGRTFKPEKFPSHMKSCKGIKSLNKTGGCGAAAATTVASEMTMSRRSTDASAKELSTYFLTR